MVRHVSNAPKIAGRAGAKTGAPKLKKTAFGVGNASSNPDRKLSAAKTNGGDARTKSKIKVLNMYKGGKAIRSKDGTVVGGDLLMKTRAGGKEIDATTGRVQPDRRWFGNTRTVGATELDRFRDEMRVKAADPYSVILRRKKLPMGLLVESTKMLDGSKAKLLEVETFDEAFNGKRQRKRPKINATSLDNLVESANAGFNNYDFGKDKDAVVDADSMLEGRRHDLFLKGQSKRIWSELYKVIDCSDVVLQILDARNIPGTRCLHLEAYLKKHAAHKHMIFVVNKCDLVPTWVTKKWVTLLSRHTPTLAFHASMGAPFGKGALISLLRQFSKLHSDKKSISVGIVGYPNVGKSSIINTLRSKKVCKTAPVPGETKIWQYVSLMKRISLVDCPGIVYDMGDSEVDTVLKGVVRAERLPDPTDFIPAILERSKPEHITRTYGVVGWKDADDLMTQIAKRNGRLLKNGEPDFHAVAVNMINDWQRGKLPFFVPPPTDEMMGIEPVVEASEETDAAFESAMLQAKELKGGEGADTEEGGKMEDDNAEELEEVEEEEEDEEDEEEGEEYEDEPAPEQVETAEYAPRPLSKRHQRAKAKFHKLEASGLDWDDL